MTKTKTKPATNTGVARVAVFDATNANRKRAADVCRQLGCDVFDSGDAAAVIERLRGDAMPDVALIGLPSGHSIVGAARALGFRRPVLVVTLPGPAETAAERCDQAGADLFAVRPLDADALAAVIRAARVIERERRRVATLIGNETLLRERLAKAGARDDATGLQHFSYFQTYLVTELKRAKRYGYSLAAVLVSVDSLGGEDAPSAEAARRLRSRVASAIKACIREVDVAVDYADDRMLVFLPYTDLPGAEHVGKRIARAVAEYGAIEDGDRTLRAVVSVGISASKEGKPVSFARLMRDAGAAVRAARLQGGGRVVVRK